jgi:hypothetical protein
MTNSIKPLYIVGAEATVIRAIEDDVTVVGSPAKIIKKHTIDRSGECYNAVIIFRSIPFKKTDIYVSGQHRRVA